MRSVTNAPESFPAFFFLRPGAPRQRLQRWAFLPMHTRTSHDRRRLTIVKDFVQLLIVRGDVNRVVDNFVHLPTVAVDSSPRPRVKVRGRGRGGAKTGWVTSAAAKRLPMYSFQCASNAGSAAAPAIAIAQANTRGGEYPTHE